MKNRMGDTVTVGPVAYPGDVSTDEVPESKHDPEPAEVNAGVHIDGILAANISSRSGRFMRVMQLQEYMQVEEVIL